MVQLTPEMIASLHALEETVNVIGQEIERAKRAGLDVSELEDRLNNVESMRQGILKEYAPAVGRRRRT